MEVCHSCSGIDGYSRILVFIHCSTNNTAGIVLGLFQTAVDLFGLPSRVRTDKGGESVSVAGYMLNHPLRGPGRASHITGRSVHNQRIERFWRDLFSRCTSLFYYLFYHMESSGILDTSNEQHLFALNYVFSHIINRNLTIFQHGHNRSPIRTERNLSPEQLWIQGLCTNGAADSRISQECSSLVMLTVIVKLFLKYIFQLSAVGISIGRNTCLCKKFLTWGKATI